MGVIIAMCGIFMAVVTGVFFVYRRMVRGRAQRVILMDGAICSLISEREVMIRPRVLFNLLVVGMLSLFMFGIFVLVINSIIEGTFRLEPDVIGTLLLGILIPGAAIPLSVRRLLKPSYYFNGGTDTLRISGRAGRTIAFNEIEMVTRKSTQVGAHVDEGSGMQTIVVALKDGSSIEPGTVSGPAKAAVERAQQIVTVLAQMTGAADITAPVSNSR